MEVVTIETPSLGDRTYLVHDGQAALVVDPQRDVDRVLDEVDRLGVTVERICETHVHNDYVSGGLVLARMTGAVLVHAAEEALRFDHEPVADGDRFAVGELEVEVVATPGHTEHHLGFVVRHGGEPAAVFTGGSLLYGTVGRTDLLGDDLADRLTRAQLASARRIAEMLPDDARVYPTHGFGSFCASASSDGESDGTLGTERRINIALRADDEDEFVERLLAGLTAHPKYYAHMGPLNRAGGGPVDLSPPAATDPVDIARRIHRGEWVIDLRPRRDFAAEHLAGTVGMEFATPFSTHLGWIVPWGMPITLLADDVDEIAEAQRQLVRIGIDRPMAAAAGGLDSWAGDTDRRSYEVVDFASLAAGGPSDETVLDVRRVDEFADGHVDGAVNVPLHELLGRLADLPDGPFAVHCASGYRASVAAALLDRAGREVRLIDDEFAAAAEAGLRIVADDG